MPVIFSVALRTKLQSIRTNAEEEAANILKLFRLVHADPAAMSNPTIPIGKKTPTIE